jgi:hypothetical protein
MPRYTGNIVESGIKYHTAHKLQKNWEILMLKCRTFKRKFFLWHFRKIKKYGRTFISENYQKVKEESLLLVKGRIKIK